MVEFCYSPFARHALWLSFFLMTERFWKLTRPLRIQSAEMIVSVSKWTFQHTKRSEVNFLLFNFSNLKIVLKFKIISHHSGCPSIWERERERVTSQMWWIYLYTRIHVLYLYIIIYDLSNHKKLWLKQIVSAV